MGQLSLPECRANHTQLTETFTSAVRTSAMDWHRSSVLFGAARTRSVYRCIALWLTLYCCCILCVATSHVVCGTCASAAMCAPQCRRFGNERRMHDDDGFRRLHSCGRVRRNEFWVGPFHGTARQEQFVQTDEPVRVLERTSEKTCGVPKSAAVAFKSL